MGIHNKNFVLDVSKLFNAILCIEENFNIIYQVSNKQKSSCSNVSGILNFKIKIPVTFHSTKINLKKHIFFIICTSFCEVMRQE